MINLRLFVAPGKSTRGISCGKQIPVPYGDGYMYTGFKIVESIASPYIHDKKFQEMISSLFKKHD